MVLGSCCRQPPQKKKLPNKLLLSGGTKQTEKEGTFQTPPAASLTLRDSGNTNAGHFGECVCQWHSPRFQHCTECSDPAGIKRCMGRWQISARTADRAYHSSCSRRYRNAFPSFLVGANKPGPLQSKMIPSSSYFSSLSVAFNF